MIDVQRVGLGVRFSAIFSQKYCTPLGRIGSVVQVLPVFDSFQCNTLLASHVSLSRHANILTLSLVAYFRLKYQHILLRIKLLAPDCPHSRGHVLPVCKLT